LSLSMKGEGILPRLSFDKREILMPVVPTNVESRCRFNVINEGYDNLEVDAKVAGDTSQIPVRIEFPEGNQIGVTKRKLMVDVIMISKKPLSFTTKLNF